MGPESRRTQPLSKSLSQPFAMPLTQQNNRKTKHERTPPQTAPKHNFRKSKHSIFSKEHVYPYSGIKLDVWDDSENHTIRTFLASTVHGGQTAGRPHGSQNETLLQAKQEFIETEGRQVSPSLTCRFTINTRSRDIALGQHIQDWKKCAKICAACRQCSKTFAVWRDGAAYTPNAGVRNHGSFPRRTKTSTCSRKSLARHSFTTHGDRRWT